MDIHLGIGQHRFRPSLPRRRLTILPAPERHDPHVGPIDAIGVMGHHHGSPGSPGVIGRFGRKIATEDGSDRRDVFQFTEHINRDIDPQDIGVHGPAVMADRPAEEIATRPFDEAARSAQLAVEFIDSLDGGRDVGGQSMARRIRDPVIDQRGGLSQERTEGGVEVIERQ